MSTFLGIGLGPIQTGIFLHGAAEGQMDRRVVAEVDAALVQAVRDNGGTIQLNIASNEAVHTKPIAGIEIYNPSVPTDLEQLTLAAAQADEVATALPSIAFFKHLEWLKAGFAQQPDRRRFVYAAENHNHAAEALEETTGVFPETRYLNTVVGKMSCVLPADECARRGLPPLTPTSDRSHLVEEFSRILIQSCPGIGMRRVQGLYDKPELLPFEEAKLFGHNAIHFWLGLHAHHHGIPFMHNLVDHADLLSEARQAFVDESGMALCRKWGGHDPLFTPSGFAAYADDLLDRMVNPFLSDRVDRICRDLDRKLGWNDRIIGAMRLAIDHQVEPVLLAKGAALAASSLFGTDLEAIRTGLASIWQIEGDEPNRIWQHIEQYV